MRTHTFLLHGALLLTAAAPLAAYGQFQAPTPQELSMTSDPKAPGAPAVYLDLEKTEDDPHHFITVYARIKVLTEQGKQAATVHIRYPRALAFRALGDNSSHSSSGMENHWDAPDPNQVGQDQPWNTDTFNTHIEVKALEARVIEPDGTIIPLKGTPDELLKVTKIANQPAGATFTVPDVKVGSIIEYRYQVRYDRFQSAPEWDIQQPYFVEKAHFMFVPTQEFLPHDVSGSGFGDSALMGPHDQILNDVRATNILPPGKDIQKDALGRYVLDLTDIPAIPQEPFAPPVSGRIYQMNFYYTFTVVQKDFWQKEMEFWTKAVDKYTAPTPLIKTTAAEAVSAADTPLEKAKKLYALVQKLTNTDVASGTRPIFTDAVPRGSVETVLQDKRGNSEQLAFLYLSLARAAGLDARPERIASRDRAIFSVQFLNTEQLDSVVIGVKIGGNQVTVDPGEKMAPFQTLYWAHAGAGGVALGPDGKVETLITPLQKNTDNTIVRVGTLSVGPDGSVSGALKVGFIGQEALELRQLAVRSGPDAVKQTLQQMIDAEVPDGVKAHIDVIAGLDDPDKQLVAVVPVAGTLPGHAAGRIVLPRLFFESKESDPFPAENPRVLPVDMHYPAQQQEQITYLFPHGFALDGTPQDATIKWEENAAYALRSKKTAGSFTTARILARGFTLLDASQYDKLRDFYQKVDQSDHQQIVLTAAQSSGD